MTKDMAVTCFNKQRELTTTYVSRIFRTFSSAEVIFERTLKFDSNNEDVVSKCQEQQYLIGKVNYGRYFYRLFVYSFHRLLIPMPLDCRTRPVCKTQEKSAPKSLVLR